MNKYQGYPIRDSIYNCMCALNHCMKDAAKVDRKGSIAANRRLRRDLKEVIDRLQYVRKLSIQRSNQEKELRSLHKERVNADLS